MAADWIKMRCDLQTHPKVVRIASAMCTDRLRVIGGLHAVWSLFDAHSSDGSLDGYTAEAIDLLIGWPGFAAAMSGVCWLESNTQGVVLPRFDTHNGQSAKRRANDAERKRSDRNPHAVRNVSANDADGIRTREEKRREDKEHKSEDLFVASKPATCPHQDIISAYHELLPSLARVREWTPERQSFLRKRWSEKQERQTLDWWREFFSYVGQSDFLMGRRETQSGAFECDLEWLVRPKNFIRVLEGRYENRGKPT